MRYLLSWSSIKVPLKRRHTLPTLQYGFYMYVFVHIAVVMTEDIFMMLLFFPCVE